MLPLILFGSDPVTDQKTGRTFASNSTVGANAVYVTATTTVTVDSVRYRSAERGSRS